MKKFLTGAIAATAIIFAASSAFAAFSVKVATTQPKFGVKGPTSCEKAGTITFTFPTNATLTIGDTYSMTLQDGVLLCNTIDYVIGSSAGATGLDETAPGSGVYNGVVFSATTGQDGVINAALTGDPGINSAVLNMPADNADNEKMPVKSNGAEINTTTNHHIYTVAGTDGAATGMYLHVYGKAKSNILTVKVLGRNAPVPADGLLGDRIVLGPNPNDTLEIRLFNGKRFDNDDDTDNIDAILMPGKITGVTTAAYGLAITDEEPTVYNSLCITVPTTFAPNCVQLRYDSSDIVGNTPCDFSNDFDIACYEERAYVLKECAKGFIGEIGLTTTSQSASAYCGFDYETPGPTSENGYCALPAYQGNRIVIISNKNIFAPTSEKMLVEYTSLTSGLYFGGMPAAGTFNVADDACKRDIGTTYRDWSKTPDNTITVLPESCNITTPLGTTQPAQGSSPFTKDTDCAIAAADRITKISQIANAFSVVSTAQAMLIDLDTMVYDSTEFALDKVEAKINVTLKKKPCGTLFTGDIKLGTFVKECSEVGSSLSLFFPYFPAMGEAWWSGLVITNGSEAAGDATCVLYDEAGNSASFKTGSIPAGGQKVILLDDTITLTPVKGTFDKTKKFSIKTSAEFSNAAGLVVFGNGLDGQGVYKPYLGNEFSSLKD